MRNIKATNLTPAQLELKNAVDEIMLTHPGGEAFFDTLDNFIMTSATKIVFDELLIKTEGLTVVLSGKFGKEMANRIDAGELGDVPYILYNGGIRSGASPELIKLSGILTPQAVFVDDTIYGGRTYFVLKDYTLSEMGIDVKHVSVVYDGCPEYREFVKSVFRFYDVYDAVPNHKF